MVWRKVAYLVVILSFVVVIDAGLFDNAINLKEVTDGKLDDLIYNKDYVSVVLLYKFGCGACKEYATTFKTITKDCLLWSPAVKFITIDCENHKNLHACYKFKHTEGVPKLHMIAPHYPNGENNLGQRVEKEELKEKLAQFLVEHSRKPTELLPNLDDYQGTTFQDLLDCVPRCTKLVILILQNQYGPSFDSVSLIMKLRHLKNVVVKRTTANQYYLPGTTVPGVYAIWPHSRRVDNILLPTPETVDATSMYNRAIEYLILNSLQDDCGHQPHHHKIDVDVEIDIDVQ